MTEARTSKEAVKIVRASSLDKLLHDPAGTGRATVFDFVGNGSQRTWIGRVSLQPSAMTGAHHHGRHEVIIYVVSGSTEIRWGDRLEFVSEVSTGDFVYFSPYVTHQERNLSAQETAEFIVVRSDNEKIAVALDIAPVDRPESVY